MQHNRQIPKSTYFPPGESSPKQATSEILSTPGHPIRLLQRLMAPAPEYKSMQTLFKDGQSKRNRPQ